MMQEEVNESTNNNNWESLVGSLLRTLRNERKGSGFASCWVEDWVEE